MSRICWIVNYLLIASLCFGQSPSFQTYVNPVIPGDHPDPTLTKIGNTFYTSGSSFNPTPKIYRSTDLVHWEVIAQPVSASWSQYGDNPGGGIWGGHMVLYNDVYWHFFGRGGSHMYFVTADQPEGPWSTPTRVQIPSGISGLGVDNSMFIDEDTGKWYLLAKHGRQNNHIVELGPDGQPTGEVLDLTWLNPDSEGNPYGWAEGPVMWKANGYYYYSFAQHLAGSQYVMRSDTLTEEESAWTIVSGTIFTGSRRTYNTPNHIAPVVMLDDGTSWTIAHSYHSSSSWYAHGRQGLLCQVTYNEQGFPVIQYPPDDAVQAPLHPSSGIPWMVPHSDQFESENLHPEWSFLGYTPDNTHSLSERPGWMKLSPVGHLGKNTIIKNDGEHHYSLITRLDFDPGSAVDEAGLWILNGPESLHAKVFSTVNNGGQEVLAFSYRSTSYESENTVGSTVWLKLIRNEHTISGFYSADGLVWTQIGKSINARDLDKEVTQFNNFTGNQQGLYVEGKAAFFDLYIYKDAYTPIIANSPANQFGTARKSTREGYVLGDIHANDWTMYAGVEFGNDDYSMQPDSLTVTASSASAGGVVQVWLDSLDSGTKIGECIVTNTGGWDIFEPFSCSISQPISENHDVYLKFTGSGSDELIMLESLNFNAKPGTQSSTGDRPPASLPERAAQYQNYPNPFNPTTTIVYNVPQKVHVKIHIYDTIGRPVATLVDEKKDTGQHNIQWDASEFGNGVYFCKLDVRDTAGGAFSSVKKLILLKSMFQSTVLNEGKNYHQRDIDYSVGPK